MLKTLYEDNFNEECFGIAELLPKKKDEKKENKADKDEK